MVRWPHDWFLSVSCALVVLVVLVVPAGTMADASDSGFRCESGRLVLLNDHMTEVLDKCGEPDFVTQRKEKRKVKVKVRRRVGDHLEEVTEEEEVEVPIDEWTYDLGPKRFRRIVSFENSRVVGVATGDHGKRKS